jgi:hypothetical protein
MYYRFAGDLKYNNQLKERRYKAGHTMWWALEKSTNTTFFYVYMGNGYFIITK